MDSTGWEGRVVVLLAPVEAEGMLREKLLLDLEALYVGRPWGRGDVMLRSEPTR